MFSGVILLERLSAAFDNLRQENLRLREQIEELREAQNAQQGQCATCRSCRCRSAPHNTGYMLGPPAGAATQAVVEPPPVAAPQQVEAPPMPHHAARQLRPCLTPDCEFVEHHDAEGMRWPGFCCWRCREGSHGPRHGPCCERVKRSLCYTGTVLP